MGLGTGNPVWSHHRRYPLEHFGIVAILRERRGGELVVRSNTDLDARRTIRIVHPMSNTSDFDPVDLGQPDPVIGDTIEAEIVDERRVVVEIRRRRNLESGRVGCPKRSTLGNPQRDRRVGKPSRRDRERRRRGIDDHVHTRGRPPLTSADGRANDAPDRIMCVSPEMIVDDERRQNADPIGVR